MISGEKVNLVPITSADTGNIVKWRNNPEVKKNFIFRETFTNEMHEKWLKDRVETGEVIQYIIEDKSEHKSVGSVYLRDIDMNERTAEFGIFIGEDSARGKGLGTETTTLFSNYALSIGLKTLFLRVIKENESAIAAYLRSGFVESYVDKQVRTSDGSVVEVIFMKKELEN